MKLTEETIATRLQNWLTAQGWDCYPEVQLRSGTRVDLVATRGPIVHAIEVKTTASLAVLEQAMGHRRMFHLVSVATPYTKSQGFRSVCRAFGIGWIRIHDEVWIPEEPERWRREAQPARIEIAPILDRSAHAAARRIRERLSPQHKRFSPGNASCAYWTPYRATCEQILREVQREPRGVPLRELVRRIKHHYGSDATAVSCLRKWIQAGKVPGVVETMDGKRVLVAAAAEVAG